MTIWGCVLCADVKHICFASACCSLFLQSPSAYSKQIASVPSIYLTGDFGHIIVFLPLRSDCEAVFFLHARSVRSTPIIGVDAERSKQLLAVAISPYHQTQLGKSRFCYHLFYRCITHMQHPYERFYCCILTGLVFEVVIRLTYYHSPLRQSKLLAGRTFTPLQLVASHLQGWGSRLKQTTGSPFALRLTSERVHSVITIGTPALIQFRTGHHGLHVYLSIIAKNAFKCGFATRSFFPRVIR
jgi:hypothetical protein